MGARSFKCLDSSELGPQAKAFKDEVAHDQGAIQMLMGPAERFEIVKTWRNMNPRLQGAYEEAKAKIRKCVVQRGECATAQLGCLPAGLNALDGSVNEFLLFHGTSSSAAAAICSRGFDAGLSGVGRSNLLSFGRGVYFAETSSKADQFAKEEDGVRTMLICRVTCGHMRRSADWAGGPQSRQGTPPQSRQSSRRGTPTGSRHPTPPGTPCGNSRQVSSITLPALMEALQASQGDGPPSELKRQSIDEGIGAPVFHSTLGHRETAGGFHREFILEDDAQAFVEYVVHYKRRGPAGLE